MTRKLRGWGGALVRPQMFLLGSAAYENDVTWRNNHVMFPHCGHLGSSILDYLIFLFPKPLKSTKLDHKIIEINRKRVSHTSRRAACESGVVMLTSNFEGKSFLYQITDSQINSRESHQLWWLKLVCYKSYQRFHFGHKTRFILSMALFC